MVLLEIADARAAPRPFPGFAGGVVRKSGFGSGTGPITLRISLPSCASHFWLLLVASGKGLPRGAVLDRNTLDRWLDSGLGVDDVEIDEIGWTATLHPADLMGDDP